jgi:hypothetical protein
VDGGALGGFLRLAAAGTKAHVWAALVGDGRDYLLVREEDVPLPTGATPEIRAEALWCALECETPLEHWTVGLEAFAVALDDPDDAWRGERGDRIGLGFDLEWEASAAPVPEGTSFWQRCEVHGEILIGPTERLTIAATGWRHRSWGSAAVPSPPGVPAEPRHRAPLLTGGERVLYQLSATGDWQAVSTE